MAKKQAKTEVRGPVIGFQITAEDRSIINALQDSMSRRMGKISISTILRIGLRKLAESEGVKP